MPLDVDEQSRVATLGAGVQQTRDKLAAAGVVKPAAPLFIRSADGSVQTSTGTPLRGPIAPAPVKVK